MPGPNKPLLGERLLQPGEGGLQPAWQSRPPQPAAPQEGWGQATRGSQNSPERRGCRTWRKGCTGGLARLTLPGCCGEKGWAWCLHQARPGKAMWTPPGAAPP